MWALFLDLCISRIITEAVPSELERVDTQSSGTGADSVDSASEFEKNLRVLLPDLQIGSSLGNYDPAKGSRRSKRQKKPSSRFNEEAGFIPEPPRSSKKKLTQDGNVEGVTSKPLLFSYWTNAQLSSYCNVCGIVFSESQNECLHDIYLIKLSWATPVLGQAETSDEVWVL